MCEQLGELREALCRYAKAFEAQCLTPAAASVAVDHASAIESVASTLKALAAARAAESDSWRKGGHRSPAEALAVQSGVSPGAAREVLEVGRRLGSQPDVAGAALGGELSASQTALVSDAAAADPASAARLVERARTSSLGELRMEVARTKAAGVDLEARRREIHKRRRLRAWSDPEGVWHLVATGNPEHGAKLLAALDPIRDKLFAKARAEGVREHPDAYAFDALIQLATTPPDRRSHAASAKLIIRVDYDTWMRGGALAGETCELVGYGPVAVSVVDDMVATGDPFIAAVLTKAQKITGVAHLGRCPNAYQQSALEWLYPTCAADGCVVRARLERDHEIDWAKTHYTIFEHLDSLCRHHHSLKTRQNWALVAGRGKRPFVPPGDPRHPNSRPPP